MEREETRLRRGAFLLRDAMLQDYLSGIVARLAGEHAADIRVYAVRTPWFNASMAPNGMMQVWTGLLLRVDNEAQLAAVLGHEIGHYLQRHSLDRLRDARSRSAMVSLLAFAGGAGLIGQLALLAGGLAYSRDHEREADRIGLTLMDKAGYDTRQAALVWRNLRTELSAGAGGDPAKKSVLFATRPLADEREAELTARARDGGERGDDRHRRHLDPLLWRLLEDELKRGQYDETLVLLGRHSAARPDRADLRYFRGEALRLRAGPGDDQRAMEEMQACLALDDPPPPAHRAMGLLLRQKGLHAQARSAFMRYLEAVPSAPDAGMVQTYLTELAS